MIKCDRDQVRENEQDILSKKYETGQRSLELQIRAIYSSKKLTLKL